MHTTTFYSSTFKHLAAMPGRLDPLRMPDPRIAVSYRIDGSAYTTLDGASGCWIRFPSVSHVFHAEGCDDIMWRRANQAVTRMAR